MAERGQATLEYLLVLMAFLAIVLAMGSLWHAAQDGRLAQQDCVIPLIRSIQTKDPREWVFSFEMR